MKILLKILVFVFTVNIISAQETFKIRGYEWRTSIDVVLEKEGSPDRKYVNDPSGFVNHEYIDLYYNNRKVAGYNADIVYHFVLNKLSRVEYYIKGIITFSAQSVFTDIKDKLVSLYGKYDESSRYLDIRKDYSNFLLLEDLSYIDLLEALENDKIIYSSYKWSHNDTAIDLSINTLRDRTLEIEILYTSPFSLQDSQDAINKLKNNKDGL
jgi:hypothetical protein